MTLPLDQKPVIVAVAGPNGAGKTTFYHSHLQTAGLRLVNADVLTRELELDAYAAAGVAEAVRRQLVAQRESFVMETVFSDPVGDKVNFLKSAADAGYNVILCFIGISSPKVSETRVAMRTSQGGHDVPPDKLRSRFPRTMANLGRAIHALRRVLVFDNDDLRAPYRKVIEFENGRTVFEAEQLPGWLAGQLPPKKRR